MFPANVVISIKSASEIAFRHNFSFSHTIRNTMCNTNCMSASRFSISISEEIAKFVESYQDDKNIGSRSEVIERALKLLREKELQQAYYEAGEEWLNSEDSTLWESTISDELPE